MPRRRTTAALFISLLTTAVAMAQVTDAPSTSEFGRASAGQIRMLTKGSRALSGSLGLRAGDSLRGYEASLGGTLLDDRLWFFGSTTSNLSVVSPVSRGAVPVDLTTAKLDAQFGDRQSLSASFGAMDNTALPAAFNVDQASSFLSLRYAATMSSNFFFDGSISRTTGSQRGISPLTPLQ